MVCSLGSGRMAVMARLLEAGSTSPNIAGILQLLSMKYGNMYVMGLNIQCVIPILKICTPCLDGQVEMMWSKFVSN